MLNYYDELKSSILEVLEIEEEYKEIINQATNKDDAFEELYDRFFVNDYITGNGSGSYYFSSYKARKQCYNFSSNVIEALDEYGYKEKLELFKRFEALADEGYLNVETMELDYESIEEVIDESEKDYIYYDFEQVEDLDFETIDVITRCYMLSEVLDNVLDAIL